MPIAITLEPGVYFRCTCGKSESLPFCDGHHQEGGHRPIRFELKNANGSICVAAENLRISRIAMVAAVFPCPSMISFLA